MFSFSMWLETTTCKAFAAARSGQAFVRRGELLDKGRNQHVFAEHAVDQEPAFDAVMGGGIQRLLLGRGVREQLGPAPGGEPFARVLPAAVMGARRSREDRLDLQLQGDLELGVMLFDGCGGTGVRFDRGDDEGIHGGPPRV